MVMSEVSLRRIEERLLGIALQLRPTLAVCDPAVLSVDWGHSSVHGRALGVPDMARRSLLVAVAPGGHGDIYGPRAPLAIRFHNVAGTCSRG
jgi:hypothetical protein